MRHWKQKELDVRAMRRIEIVDPLLCKVLRPGMHISAEGSGICIGLLVDDVSVHWHGPGGSVFDSLFVHLH